MPDLTENIQIPLIPRETRGGAPVIVTADLVNQLITWLERAANGLVDIEIPTSGGADIIESLYQRYFVYRLVDDDGGGPSGAFTATVPDDLRHVFAVFNATAQTATIQRESGGTSVSLDTNRSTLIYNDATNLVELTNEAAPIADPYTVVGFFKGTPAASNVIFMMEFEREVTFEEDFAGSGGLALTAPSTASVTFDVERDTGGGWTDVGDFSYNTSGVISFNTDAAGDLVFAQGDFMRIVAPADLDGIEDFGWTMKGTR